MTLYVRVKKLGISPNSNVPTPKMYKYVMGQVNKDVSLPVNYEVEGYIDNVPEEGESLIVSRTKRNGVSAFGIMQTSPLALVYQETNNKYFLETQNSFYEMEVLGMS